MGFMRSLVHGIEFGIGASKMTNLEALRQELKEFIDKASESENICSKGITQWLRQEHEDND